MFWLRYAVGRMPISPSAQISYVGRWLTRFGMTFNVSGLKVQEPSRRFRWQAIRPWIPQRFRLDVSPLRTFMQCLCRPSSFFSSNMSFLVMFYSQALLLLMSLTQRMVSFATSMPKGTDCLYLLFSLIWITYTQTQIEPKIAEHILLRIFRCAWLSAMLNLMNRDCACKHSSIMMDDSRRTSIGQRTMLELSGSHYWKVNTFAHTRRRK